MADIDEAKRKREETRELDNYENKNPYTRSAMKGLVTGEPSKGVMATDFAIDILPSLAMLIIGKAIKNSSQYKKAKLRESANITDYSITGGDVLTHMEGSSTSPYGQLSRAVKKYYGRPEEKEFQKRVEKGIWDAAKKIKKVDKNISDEEIVEMVEMVRTGKKAQGANEEYLNIIKNSISDNVKDFKYTPAQKIVDENVKTTKTPSGKVKVEVNRADKLAANAPGFLAGTSALLGAGDVANAAFKMKEPKNLASEAAKQERGLESTSPFFTITELLDSLSNGTFRYNKKEATREANKIFDYIEKNGDEHQIKEAYRIYADTDFNKKGEAISALKQMLRLVQ